MDPAQLKTNFEEQIGKTDAQITELETNLAKAKEYKLEQYFTRRQFIIRIL